MTPTPNSTHARDVASHLHPYTNLAVHSERGPHILQRGQGIYVFDDDGKRYVEGLSGLQYAHNAFDVPIKNILHTDCPHYYHYGEDGESEEDYASRLAANLEDLIQSEGPDTIAAFIAEPILEAHDDPDALSVAFQIAQGRDVPMHMWVMSFTVREFLKRIPKGRASPGDMWFLALPKVGGNHETSQRIADAIFKAIEPVCAENLTAGGPTTSGLLLLSGRRADGVWTTLYETYGGGKGAYIDRDGADVIRVHMSKLMNTPAEVIEAEYPFRIDCQKLRQGSGGGRHSGGDGVRHEYRILCRHMSVASLFERRVIAPYGLPGGEDREAFFVHLEDAGGQKSELTGKTKVRLNTGDVVVVNSYGGGGCGKP